MKTDIKAIMVIDKNQKIDAEAMMQYIIRQKSLKRTFKFPFGKQEVFRLLAAAYKAEVISRNIEFVCDKSTEESIMGLADFLTNGGMSAFGVMFTGNCGSGKTTLLYAFRDVLNYLVDKRAIDERGIVVVDAKDIAEYAKDRTMRERLRSYEMLAIEDLGRESTDVLDYGNVSSPVSDLFEYRYNNRLFTMITTNLSPDEIGRKYGVRIADRFSEMFTKIVFEGNPSYKNRSYRRQKEKIETTHVKK